MSTLTGKDLNLVKPALTDDHKVTIGTDLPANFQKIDDAFSAHLADLVTDADGVHGLKIETGLFTPTLKGSTADGTFTTSILTGKYRKIEKLVFAHIEIRVTAISSATGDLYIGGLPFTPSGNYTISINRYSNVTLSGGYSQLGGYTIPTSIIILTEMGTQVPAKTIKVTSLNPTPTVDLFFDCIYEV